jgi:hypothetical protein
MRPQIVGGWAVSGMCLIRLGGTRPLFLPAPLGPGSENAAHRIAVEWDTPDGIAYGVHTPRRDTGSRINALAGGRLFPGRHHLSRFEVRENATDLRIAYIDPTDATSDDVRVRTAATLSGSRLFAGLGQASEFFRRGSAGYSVTPDPTRLDGVELHTPAWRPVAVDPARGDGVELHDTARYAVPAGESDGTLPVTPVEPVSVRSTFFDDPDRFPPGSATLDCGLLMRDLAAVWKPLPSMAVRAAGGLAAAASR